MNVFRSFLVCLALSSVSLAHANIEVQFVESAPKDRFTILNSGECELTNVEISIDLTDTQGKLIFDTTENGAGVEVFQPFEVTEGDMALSSAGSVADGDKVISVRVLSLPSQQSMSFTIDVDDTLKNSALGQIRVAGEEIKDGEVRLTLANNEVRRALFGSNKLASVTPGSC
ncbi:MAG: aggregation factor core [Gammaproteobacteria bacterium]|nr:aggregation factor core [Gammaproteobacteria bacterium]